jgi:hypothetical protein
MPSVITAIIVYAKCCTKFHLCVINSKPITLHFIMQSGIFLSVVNDECNYSIKPSIPKRSDLDCSTRCLSSDNCTAYTFNKNPPGTETKKCFFTVDAKNKLEHLSLVNNLGREY